MWCFLKVRLSKTWTPLPALTPYPFNGNRIQGNAAGLPPEVCELELRMLHQSWDQTNVKLSVHSGNKPQGNDARCKKTCPLNLVQVGTQKVKSRPDFRCGASCVRPSSAWSPPAGPRKGNNAICQNPWRAPETPKGANKVKCLLQPGRKPQAMEFRIFPSWPGDIGI